MLRIAIIGTGWWGNELAKAARSLPALYEIHGCFSREARLAETFRTNFGGMIYESVENCLLDQSVDAVFLATPHSTHADQIIAAAKARKHVFVEKPMTLTVASGKAAIAACAANRVTLGIGHNRRYSPVARQMKAMIQDGSLGQVLHVEGNYSSPGGTRYVAGQWRAQREECPGGGIAPMGLHIIDTMSWLLGPVARLASLCKRQVLTVAIDDTSACLFELASGVTGTLGCIFAAPVTSYLRIYGTRANIEARDDFKELIVEPLDRKEPVTRQHFAIDDTLPAELRAFAAACAGEAAFPVRPEEALHNVAVMEAIAASSAANGAFVTLRSVAPV